MKRRKKRYHGFHTLHRRYILKISDIILMVTVAILNITDCILSFLSDGGIFIKIIGAVFLVTGVFAALGFRRAYIALEIFSAAVIVLIMAEIYKAGIIVFLIGIVRFILSHICQSVLSGREQSHRASYDYY